MTIETKVTFSVADLKALGNPLLLFTSIESNASFDGEISWDYHADEGGLHGLHWYVAKRSVDILGYQVAELYDQARDHLQELAGDL